MNVYVYWHNCYMVTVKEQQRYYIEVQIASTGKMTKVSFIANVSHKI